MKQLRSRQQRTLAQPVEVIGIGYLTGADVTVRFLPARENTGVNFVRTDLKSRNIIAALVDNITDTNRRTTLGYMPRCVSLTEHVLAALAGLRIDNCTVELDALEPPGLDGSARQFVKALQQAGVQTQNAERAVWTVERTILVERRGATLALHPANDNELRVSYLLDYGPQAAIMPQRHTGAITPETFSGAIAGCRTYLLEQEAEALRRQGIGKRTKINDLVVFGATGPIENRLRFADEPARHKILDIIGDLSLLGCDLRGRIVGYRSGHPLNAELARKIQNEILKADGWQCQAA